MKKKVFETIEGGGGKGGGREGRGGGKAGGVARNHGL